MTSQSIKQITARAAQEVADFIGVTAEVAMRDHADTVFKMTCAIMAARAS
jgi:hypothetical protein